MVNCSTKRPVNGGESPPDEASIELGRLSYFDNYMAVDYYSIKQIEKPVLVFMCRYLHFSHQRLIEI